MISYNVNKNRLDDIVPFLPDSGVVVIASRPGWGEERFLSDIIQYYDRADVKVDVWDLYGDMAEQFDIDVFKCRLTIRDVPKMLDAGIHVYNNRLYIQLAESAASSVLMLIGVQAMQMKPFDAEEMSEVMEKILSIASGREKPIIVYSGLPAEGNVQKPSTETLAAIGFPVPRISCIFLENLYDAPRIGPFFYVRGKLVAVPIPLYDGRKQSDKLDSPLSHEKMFDRLRLYLFVKQMLPMTTYDPVRFDDVYNRHALSADYIDYPRGRVIWDTTAEEAVIYIDPCIMNEVDNIVSCFHLNNYRIELDDHYHCKNCTDKTMLFQDEYCNK